MYLLAVHYLETLRVQYTLQNAAVIADTPAAAVVVVPPTAIPLQAAAAAAATTQAPPVCAHITVICIHMHARIYAQLPTHKHERYTLENYKFHIPRMLTPNAQLNGPFKRAFQYLEDLSQSASLTAIGECLGVVCDMVVDQFLARLSEPVRALFFLSLMHTFTYRQTPCGEIIFCVLL